MLKNIKILKWFLISLTLVELLYTAMNWIDLKTIIALDLEYRVNLILGGVHLFFVGFFVFYIWRFMPYNRKEKINNSLMILFLGVIGMWLWIPNKKELSKLNNLTTLV